MEHMNKVVNYSKDLEAKYNVPFIQERITYTIVHIISSHNISGENGYAHIDSTNQRYALILKMMRMRDTLM